MDLQNNQRRPTAKRQQAIACHNLSRWRSPLPWLMNNTLMVYVDNSAAETLKWVVWLLPECAGAAWHDSVSTSWRILSILITPCHSSANCQKRYTDNFLPVLLAWNPYTLEEKWHSQLWISQAQMDKLKDVISWFSIFWDAFWANSRDNGTSIYQLWAWVCDPNTGFTPKFLQQGREFHIPADVMFAVPLQKDVDKEPAEYARQLVDRLGIAYAQVWENFQRAQRRQKLYHDVNTRLQNLILKWVIWFIGARIHGKLGLVGSCVLCTQGPLWSLKCCLHLFIEWRISNMHRFCIITNWSWATIIGSRMGFVRRDMRFWETRLLQRRTLITLILGYRLLKLQSWTRRVVRMRWKLKLLASMHCSSVCLLMILFL